MTWLKQVGELFSRILNSYTTKKFGKIAYGKTFGKESTLFLDLLSAPDLAAGSIEHYLTRRDTIEDLTIKDSANEVLMWHSFQGVCLKKYAFIFRQGPSNLVESATLKFDAITVPEDAKFIDIRPHAVRRT